MTKCVWVVERLDGKKWSMSYAGGLPTKRGAEAFKRWSEVTHRGHHGESKYEFRIVKYVPELP